MMPARRGQPELSRLDLLRGAAGLAAGAAASLWLPESASARSISTPNSPTRRTENSPQQIGEGSLTAEALRPNLTLQGTDFRLEDGTQLEIRLLDNTDQGVRHFKEGIAALRQPSLPTQEVRSQLAKSESGREMLRLHSLAADANRDALTQAEAGGGSFTLNGHMVDARFGTYWLGNGGLRQQGLPLSDGFNENNPTNGQMYQTQYFERARFEYHPEVSDPNYQVLLGLTGAEQYKSKYPTGASNQIPNTAPGAAQFPETGKYVGDSFLAYWAANGGLRQQGLPISDEFDEVNPTDGKSYRVQYFERARFEHHPEIADPNYKVLLGLLGREQFLAKYPGGLPSAETPPTGKETVYSGNGWRFSSNVLAPVQIAPVNTSELDKLAGIMGPNRPIGIHIDVSLEEAKKYVMGLGLDPNLFDRYLLQRRSDQQMFEAGWMWGRTNGKITQGPFVCVFRDKNVVEQVGLDDTRYALTGGGISQSLEIHSDLGKVLPQAGPILYDNIRLWTI